MEVVLKSNVLENVDRFFDALGSQEQHRMIMSSIRKGARPMVDTARNLSTEHYKSGRLWYSIDIQNAPDKKDAILFGIKSGGVYVGWRGRFTDRGYTTHGPGKKMSKRLFGQVYHKSHVAAASGKWVPGHRFMEWAYRYQADNYLNTVEREIQKSIDKKAKQFSDK